ncbi:MAG TPA: hypothetical protein VKA84_01525 [Gemmatimonadaceae bacterium]|nr:hypothetical protein [Gemmatimonadaceae bacterium]
MTSVPLLGAALAALLAVPLRGCDRARPPGAAATLDPGPSPPLAPAPDPAGRCYALAAERGPGQLASERALVLDSAASVGVQPPSGRGRAARGLQQMYWLRGSGADTVTTLEWRWHASAAWAAPTADSLLVGFNYGFTGLSLRLAGRGDTLAGTSDYFSDNMEPVPRGRAVALRVPCPVLAAGDAGAAIRAAEHALRARAGW